MEKLRFCISRCRKELAERLVRKIERRKEKRRCFGKFMFSDFHNLHVERILRKGMSIKRKEDNCKINVLIFLEPAFCISQSGRSIIIKNSIKYRWCRNISAKSGRRRTSKEILWFFENPHLASHDMEDRQS